MTPYPFLDHQASHDAAAYWSKTGSAIALQAWQKKMIIKRFLWRLTFKVAEALKRIIDIFGSLIGLLIFSPFFLLIALAIYLEDRGAIFFQQVRIGQEGRSFKILKFRSMFENADEKIKELLALNHHREGVTFKTAQDPRITQVGKWIRKTSLDELPQFINVLLGNMSLVGPRPPLPREVAQYKAAQLRRLMVKPGITCLWQVSGRANIPFGDQVRLDLQYIYSESIWQDIKILLRTIPAVIFARGAY